MTLAFEPITLQLQNAEATRIQCAWIRRRLRRKLQQRRLFAAAARLQRGWRKRAKRKAKKTAKRRSNQGRRSSLRPSAGAPFQSQAERNRRMSASR